MSVEILTPANLFRPESYAQAAIGRGSGILCISGQVALDAHGVLVGPGDLARQAEQVYRNLGAALAAASATFRDVLKVTIYVVDWSPEKMQPLVEGAMRAADAIGMDAPRPMTLVGVAALAAPEFLLEAEVMAMVG